MEIFFRLHHLKQFHAIEYNYNSIIYIIKEVRKRIMELV